ncbi:MAG: EAL domain-containing protein [Rhizobium sp.]
MALRKIQWLLAAVVCCFVLASSYLSYVIIERQEALHRVAGYNETWSVSQTSSEFLRLEQVLAAYAVPGSGVRLDSVRLRLDIMFNRLGILENAAFRNFVRSNEHNKATIDTLKAALAKVDDLVPHGNDGTFDALPPINILAAIEPQVVALGSAAIEAGAQKINDDEVGLERLHIIYTGLTGGLILCGIALILLLIHHNLLLARARDNLDKATDDLQRTAEETDAQNFRYLTAFNNMSQALCMFDAGGRMIVCNDRFSTMAARPDGIGVGTTIDSIINPDATAGGATTFEQLFALQIPLVKEARRGVFMHEAADRKAYVVTHEPLPEGGWLATYEDITERRRRDAHIAHMAHHDALTNLPNRVLFMEQLERKLLEAKRDEEAVAVCFLDLDGFKDVNDTMGHHVGDQLLQRVADRLLACVGDRDVVARIGGDEFALITFPPKLDDGNLDLPVYLVMELTRPYFLDGHEITIGASVGMAQFPDHSNDPEELLKYADLAMYEAKSDGKGRVCLFRPELDARLLARKALEVDLRKALKRNEMEVYYQPLLITATRELCGYEALLRWNHPTRGQIPPAEFIPIAEDTGMIAALGAWVLRQACADASSWPEHLTVAVNLSPVQFRNKDLIQTIVRALTGTGLNPERLELEITESVLLDAGAHTASTLHALKDLGIRIAMDDFGTGYSSLSNLRSFPFDKIKIDRSFVRELTLQSDSQSVVRLITALAKTLGMSTTAEGVETEEQFACLQDIGCTQVQGYLFAKPKPVAELAHFEALQPRPISLSSSA